MAEIFVLTPRWYEHIIKYPIAVPSLLNAFNAVEILQTGVWDTGEPQYTRSVTIDRTEEVTEEEFETAIEKLRELGYKVTAIYPVFPLDIYEDDEDCKGT